MSIRGIHTWTGTVTARWPMLLAATMVVLAVVLAITVHWTLIIMVIGAAVSLPFAKLSVTADLDGLTVRFGHLGWPSKRIRLDQIAAANSTDLNPWKWGGWGYRWLPRRGWAVVIRRGPAIVIQRTNGKVFAVTVDDAPLGATTLQSHIDHQPPG